MSKRTSKSLLANVLGLALLAGSMTLAPAAQAADQVNRNTGVGAIIAAQGNAALRYLKTTLTMALPQLPKAQARKVSAPARKAAQETAGAGSLDSSTAGILCAE